MIWQAAIILTFRKIKNANNWNVEIADPKDIIELLATLVGEHIIKESTLTGVLVICRGLATKLIGILQNQVKKICKVSDLHKVNI